jgi:hypothetical protein
MKMSELPKGTLVEVSYSEKLTIRYEKVENWESLAFPGDFITVEDMDNLFPNAKIISLPYEVTLKLATWLDDVYTKTGDPESLIIEAAQVGSKYVAHIAEQPKKDSQIPMNDPRMGPPNPPNPTWNRPFG